MAESYVLLRTMAQILDGLEVAMCVFDRDDRTLLWNQVFLRFFPEHANHIHDGEPYHVHLRRFYQSRLDADEITLIDRYIVEGIARHHGQQRPYTFRHRATWLTADSLPLPGVGRVRVWRLSSAPRLSATEKGAAGSQAPLLADDTELFQHVADGVGFCSDLDSTVLKRQRQELTPAESRARDGETLLSEKSRMLEAMLERMEQGVMMVNAQRVVEVCNRRAIELLGLPPELMASKPTFAQVLEYQWFTEEFADTPEEVRQFVRNGGILDEPHCYDRKRPNGRVIEFQSVPIEGGGVLRTYTDITERRRQEDRIRHLAHHDDLTLLVNRRAFLERVAIAVHKSDAITGGFAVHYLDLDGFKPVNDGLGHAIGDKLLAIVAERLQSVVRDADIVGRMGGDEFAIFQGNIQETEQALQLAHRAIHAVQQPIEIEGHVVQVGLSVGIAMQPEHGSTTESLMRNADTAMYVAKGKGGGRVSVFDP